MTTRNTFIDELKRRRVLRVAGVYIVVAWIAIQAAATIFPALELPAWTIKFVIILAAIGLPIAIVLAWAFDLQRDRGTAETPIVATPIRRSAGLAYFGLGILVALVGYGLSSRYLLPEPRTDDGHDHSVIVLPFQNMSSDKEQEFFSDGITEEILNALAKVPGLRVPARTTSFSFKGKNMTAREIAASIGVGHVLEGSVRRAGERVRITAQLIDAKTDEHLWSEAFDRNLTDVFAVQEEIARAIADELKMRMSDASHVRVAQATTNPRAYELYLQGLHEFNRRGSGVEVALGRFREAIALDPQFARAYVALGQALAVLPSYNSAYTPAQNAKEVRAAAQKALQLDPTLAGAHAAIALQDYYEGNIEEATRGFERSIQMDSTVAQIHMWYANALTETGNVERVEAEYEKAIRLDPRSTLAHYNRAGLLTRVARYQEALPMVRTALEINPTFLPAQVLHATLLAKAGQADSARAVVQAAERAMTGARTREPLQAARVWALLGDRANAERLLGSTTIDDSEERIDAAVVYAILGDRERALYHIDRLRPNQQGGAIIWLVHSPEFNAIRSEPRFQAAIGRLRRRS